MPVQYSCTSTPPIVRTACTEPQCLYSTAIPLHLLLSVRPVQTLSSSTRARFTFLFTNSSRVERLNSLGEKVRSILKFQEKIVLNNALCWAVSWQLSLLRFVLNILLAGYNSEQANSCYLPRRLNRPVLRCHKEGGIYPIGFMETAGPNTVDVVMSGLTGGMEGQIMPNVLFF